MRNPSVRHPVSSRASQEKVQFVKRPLAQALVAAAFAAAVAMPAAAKFKDITPAADANVSEAAATTNYGTDTKFIIQSATSTQYNKRAWLRFDLAGKLPPGAVITSAKLRLYMYSADTQGDPMTIEAQGNSDDTWTEAGITWANQPAAGFDATPGAGNTPSTSALAAYQNYRWYELDVTDFVVQENSGDGTVTLMVKPQTESDSTWRTYYFNSREYNTNFTPRLRIEYTGDWPANDVVNVIHVNDIHSRLTTHDLDFPDGTGEVPAFEEAGGAAYMAAKILERKAANLNSLVLDAGDISEGNPLGDLRVNGGMVDYLKEIDTQLKALPGNSAGRGLDAIVIGNHDVRDAQMIANMQNSGLPFLAVNMLNYGAAVPAPAPWPAANPFRPYVMVDTQSSGGTPTRVAVLGYLTDDSAHLSASTETLIAVKETRWTSANADHVKLKNWVEYLRKPQAQGGEGADIVILLSHIGHRRLVGGDEILLGDMGDVAPPDAVVSGHWHTWSDTGWQPTNLNYNTLVVEAASYAQYVGEFQLSPYGRYVDAQKHPVKAAEITPNTQVAGLINTLTAEYDAIRDPARACVLPPAVTGRSYADQLCPLNHVVGYSAVDLKLDKDKWFTLSEFPWSGDNAAGEWIADATVWKLNQNGITAHLALQSGGGVRRDVKAGPVTYLDIYETYPWTDDQIVVVTLTSADIWAYLEDHYVGSSISQGWQVTADDGVVTAISYNGTPLSKTDTATTWQVAISEYMFLHDDWISESGAPYDFQSKPNTHYTQSIRDSVVEYTSQFTQANPMTVPGPRYMLNTELAGGFKAVVTMVDDAENEPYFEAVFVRLLEALPETLARRHSYGLSDLVNPDGGINPDHEFAETMWYRSHLGFPDGHLKVGDIVEVWGEGGFFAGNPQLVDQQGVVGQDTEFTLLGHDPGKALPAYMQVIADFWDEAHENRLVKFRAARTGDKTVRDSNGMEISLYKEGGYYSVDKLPGVNGDTLELVGIQTQRDADRRFRLREAAVVSGYPPSSSVNPVSGPLQVGTPVTLTATASDVNGTTVPKCQAVGNRLAHTSFEEPAAGGIYIDSNTASHALANNAGQASVVYTGVGGELGFSAYYTNSIGDVGLSDGDFIGVQTFTTDVGAYTDGAQGYELSDTDGKVTVTLDTVNLAGHPTASVCVDIFVPETTWETSNPADTLRIWVDSGSQQLDLVNVPSGSDIDNATVNGGPLEGAWRTLSLDLSGQAQATLKFELQANAAAEKFYLDNIVFTDAAAGSITPVPNPGTVTQVEFFYSADGGQSYQSVGVDTNGADGWSVNFTPPSAGNYLFYSAATDGDGLVEPTPIMADASGSTLLAQTIAFPALPDKNLGNSPVAISATASSGLPVVFSSLSPGVCHPSGNTVHLSTRGTCTIAANQTGDSFYAAAPQVVQSFNVAGYAQTISFPAPPDMALGSAPFTLAATASSGLPVQYASLTPAVCSMSGGSVSLLATGYCSIATDQPGDASNEPAPTVVQGFNVTAAAAVEDGDVPLPAWAMALLGLGLFGAMRRRLAGRGE